MDFTEKSVLPRIESNYSMLTQVEKTVADFFMNNTEKQDFSARAISRLLSVSEASLSRFAKKCGFSGYREFIFEYSQSMTEIPEQITLSAKKVFSAYQNLLNKAYNLMDENQINRIASWIDDANRVFAAGKGSSGLVAREMASRFLRIGIDIRVVDEMDSVKIQPAIMKENDVAVGLSLSGKSKEIHDFLRHAKEKNVRTILITSVNRESCKAYCDEILLVPSLGRLDYGRIISPQFPMLVMTDMLYTSCMAIDAGRHSSIHEQTLVLLGRNDPEDHAGAEGSGPESGS